MTEQEFLDWQQKQLRYHISNVNFTTYLIS